MNCSKSSCTGASCTSTRSRLKLLLLVAMVVAGVVMTTGCSDNVAGPVDVTGTYTLAQVDDKAMPAQFVDAAGSVMTFTEGELTMTEDGYCTFVLKGKLNKILFTHYKEGTYVRKGNKLTFDIPDDPYRLTSGKVSGDAVEVEYHIAGMDWRMKLKP